MDSSESPYPELDLHRLTVEEAMPRLDRFLYETYAAGIHSVRVVHGKGTGKLRSSVRAWLPRQTLVKSFRVGFPWEGGDGVTIVELGD